MLFSLHQFRAIAATLILAGIAVFAASCATPPRPLNRSLIVTIASVDVEARDYADASFASALDNALENSLGRTNYDIGESARLRLNVIERGKGYVFVRIELTAVADGQVIYTGSTRVLAGNRAAMISQIVGEMRMLLGLKGTSPKPIYGKKVAVAQPAPRPRATVRAGDHVDANAEDFDATKLNSAEMSDPLLNGTVTPDTPVAGLPGQSEPEPMVIDTSKPLLETNGQAAPSPAPQPSPKPDVAKAPAPAAASQAPTANPAPAEDAPCVVTVDNDCKDPDAR